MFILKSGAHHTINQGKNRNIKPILSCLQDALTNSVRNIRITPLLKEDNKLVEYGVKEEKSSKAMRAYLERSQEYNRFIAKESEEFRTGKRHLANMMGRDPNNFSQADVDAAIAYLFPSGLFVKKTRPMMKPPEEVHPPKKEAEFDETGRPHHYLFYTGKPNFYSYMHNLVSTMKELNAFQDAMIAKQLKPDPALALDTEGYEWLSKDAFELKFIEDITDEEHRQLIATLDRLLSHPYSYRIKDLIMEARKVNVIKTDEAIPKPELSADGRQFITVKECRRRMSRADVTVHYPGQGLLTVNGYDLSYFPDLNNREQLMFPLLMSGMMNKVDIEASVRAGGPSTQAGAVRYGIAKALRSFVDSTTVEKMRLAGLLTQDRRRKERKKPGQEGARRKFTWKKR